MWWIWNLQILYTQYREENILNVTWFPINVEFVFLSSDFQISICFTICGMDSISLDTFKILCRKINIFYVTTNKWSRVWFSILIPFFISFVSLGIGGFIFVSWLFSLLVPFQSQTSSLCKVLTLTTPKSKEVSDKEYSMVVSNKLVLKEIFLEYTRVFWKMKDL